MNTHKIKGDKKIKSHARFLHVASSFRAAQNAAATSLRIFAEAGTKDVQFGHTLNKERF